MMASFITRGLLLIFGYVYPGYECFKSVELNKPDIEQLSFWCQYWILVAGLTVCERIFDTFIGWVPMYGEAKLAFIIYLWFPKTKGTTYVYNSFFKPYIKEHEKEIDRTLLELKTRVGDMAFLYWQKASSYGHTRIFEVLQYIASQSTPPQPAQAQQQVQKLSVSSGHPSAVATQLQEGQASPAAYKIPLSEQQEDATEEGPSEDSKAATAPAAVNEQKTTPTPLIVKSSKALISGEEQTMQVDSLPPAANENAQLPPQDVVMDDAVMVTRVRPRKTLAATNR